MSLTRRFSGALLGLLLAAPVAAQIPLGALGPDFTKTPLGGGSVSLSQYAGKVVVLFLLGYSCPYCLADGKSVQQDIAQHYANTKPGEVQVLGVDLWNGTTAQLNSFRTTTGATYPLLLNGASPTGGNVEALYGTYDNYIVLNKQGLVRYHAALAWPHGNRYHLNEIRACVDSLVSNLVDVPPIAAPPVSLSASPNPARGSSLLAVTIPDPVASATVEVLDVAGRIVATPWRGPLGPGRHEWRWSARDDAGAPLAAGLYLVRARLGSASRTLRLAVTR